MRESDLLIKRNEEVAHDFFDTPIGTLRISESERGIAGIHFVEKKLAEEPSYSGTGRYIEEAKKQLEEYFSKRRTVFTVPLDLKGTEFQRAVWNQLLRIPYGEVRYYQEIAELVGRPKAARAVGMANHRNPISIIVPCHRVVGKSGALVGYAEGLDKKEYLLKWEGVTETRRPSKDR